MKYTPAPWYIAGEDEPVPGVPAIEIMYGECPSPECTSVCYVNSFLDEDFVITETTEANARLIAAAPELLGMLEECSKHLTTNNPSDGLIKLHVDEAINKATG